MFLPKELIGEIFFFVRRNYDIKNYLTLSRKIHEYLLEDHHWQKKCKYMYRQYTSTDLKLLRNKYTWREIYLMTGAVSKIRFNNIENLFDNYKSHHQIFTSSYVGQLWMPIYIEWFFRYYGGNTLYGYSLDTLISHVFNNCNNDILNIFLKILSKLIYDKIYTTREHKANCVIIRRFICNNFFLRIKLDSFKHNRNNLNYLTMLKSIYKFDKTILTEKYFNDQFESSIEEIIDNIMFLPDKQILSWLNKRFPDEYFRKFRKYQAALELMENI